MTGPYLPTLFFLRERWGGTEPPRFLLFTPFFHWIIAWDGLKLRQPIDKELLTRAFPDLFLPLSDKELGFTWFQGWLPVESGEWTYEDVPTSP